MKMRGYRISVLLMAMVLFSMAACELLQAQSEATQVPACHGKSGSAPVPKSHQDLGFKHCCEAGIIPSVTKNLDSIHFNSALSMIDYSQESLHPILPIPDLFLLTYPPGSNKFSLLSILRI